MSLVNCKECGSSISKKASKCPQCGAPAKKKTSLLTWIVTVIAVFWLIGFISGESSSPERPRGPSPKELALNSTSLNFEWEKSGFGSVMEVNLVITNDGNRDIKDIEIECTHFAKSGTRIDSNTRTIYDIVPAKGKKEFNKFNMGFIHSQVNSSSCAISDLKI